MSASSQPTPDSPARVTVLLATFNGELWLNEQLDSIFAQVDVDLSVVALDDASTDGTAALLAQRALVEPRLSVLPTQGPSGSAAANFYRLLMTAPLENADFIAFADQDDLWMPNKLARHAALAERDKLDGVSSNVTAFSEDGQRTLVRKSFPQREFDFLLESPGPGCSFLISPRLAVLVRDLLADPASQAHDADFHDWLIYAVCRGAGWPWHIDTVSSLDYRQHENNTMGANTGGRAALSRLKLVGDRWHREQATLMCELAMGVAPENSRPRLVDIHTDLVGRGVARRFSLLTHAAQLRRRPRDRAIIGMLIALGIW
jgi:rhamnosyltransferase